MKILITGGAGFIGTKICNKLKDKFEIIVLDNFSQQIHGEGNPKLIEGVDYVFGDVTSTEDWKKVMLKNPNYIIHLAAETGTGQSMDEITRYVNTNVVGTSVMLEFLNKNENNVKKIILSSTRAVYGDLENNSETSIVDPKSVYAVTKLAQENLIKTSSKVPYTILRYQNVFGDGQSLNNPYTGIISIFSNLFLENKPITLFDNGIPTRDFIYVEDVVDVTIKCLDNTSTNYKTYDVGTGIETKILDVTLKLKELSNSTSEIIITDYHRDGDIMFAKANTTKIKTDLSWEPKFTIEDGLNFFYNWFKKEKNL
jgi:dTDP-L-rhamnose 4-epimerase